MSRYIDADNLQEAFKELHGGKRSLLIDTETTADVVEVVRCKDCAHYNAYKDNYMCGLNVLAYVHEDDFCSRAERAEE